MINYHSAELKQLVIHHIGVAHLEDSLFFSDQPSYFHETNTADHLVQYLCSPFSNPEYYAFDIHQDSLYPIIRDIFNQPDLFFSKSKAIAERLYHKSNHPAIKSGELIIALLDEVVLEDEILSAIAIFKVEDKETFLQINQEADRYMVSHQLGLSLGQAQKGCLIFNTNASDGYKILSLDKKSRSEANYWAVDFLNIQARSDDYHHTERYIQMTKSFLQDTAEQEGNLSKVDQADILNKSHSFFTENIQFNDADYQDTVFESGNLGASFEQYKNNYQAEHDVAIADDFEISESAVKNNARVFKSVIKLDKNFHIYVHGDRNKIQKGQDDEGRKFYKIFYDQEK